MKVKVKAFVEAMNLFSANPTKCKAYFNDQRLTYSEKAILRCFYLYRDNQLNAISLELSKISGELDPVVHCMKNLLEAFVLNGLGNYREAIPKLEKNLPTLKKYGLNGFEFNAYLNLFIMNLNLKDPKAMKANLEAMKKVELKDKKLKLHIWVCEFNYAGYMRDFKKAELLIAKIDPHMGKMHEAVVINYLLDKFDYFIKIEDFGKAEYILNQMKDHRKFNLTTNYNFMKLLLNHYTQHSPLYFQDQEFIHHTSLYWKIKLIRSLEEGNKAESASIWQELQKLYPEQFGEPFQYLGDKNLFSVCLDKYVRREIHHSTEEALEQFESGSKVDHIYSIFKHSQLPIRKEELFAKVWGRLLDSKEDLKTLSRTIYRIRQKYGLEIKTRKGSYFVEAVDKKAS